MPSEIYLCNQQSHYQSHSSSTAVKHYLVEPTTKSITMPSDSGKYTSTQYETFRYSTEAPPSYAASDSSDSSSFIEKKGSKSMFVRTKEGI